jgi:hypothetical protein
VGLSGIHDERISMSATPTTTPPIRLIAGRQVDLLAFVIDRHLISAEELPIYMAKVEKRLATLEALVEGG